MSKEFKLQPAGDKQPEQFMTAKQYHEFAVQFQKQVKPELDKQRTARIRSEERAKRHLIG